MEHIFLGFQDLNSLKIPHYKPSGKLIFFERDEFDAWLLGNRVKTRDEISREAMNYLMKKNLKP